MTAGIFSIQLLSGDGGGEWDGEGELLALSFALLCEREEGEEGGEDDGGEEGKRRESKCVVAGKGFDCDDGDESAATATTALL
jgi:hypothetical protein